MQSALNEQRRRRQNAREDALRFEQGLVQDFEDYEAKKQKKEKEDAAVQWLKSIGMYGHDEVMLRVEVGAEGVAGFAQLVAQEAKEEEMRLSNIKAIEVSLEEDEEGPAQGQS